MQVKSLSLFCIFFLCSFLFFTSCKNDPETQQKIMTEVSFDEINNQILAATEGQNPSEIKVGQYFKYENNYQIELNEPRVNSFYEGKVLDINETNNKISVTILETTLTYNDQTDEYDEDTKEEVYTIDKITLQDNFKTLKFNTRTVIPLNVEFYSTHQRKIKAYNLEVSKSNIAYPLAIQKRLNCNPKVPCRFPATRIKYILEETLNKGEVFRVSVDRVYISNGSFLAGTFSSCQSQFVVIGDRDYYVKSCSVLRDFDSN